jgi:hypothetical protein
MMSAILQTPHKLSLDVKNCILHHRPMTKCKEHSGLQVQILQHSRFSAHCLKINNNREVV